MADREDVLRRLRTVHGMWRDPSSFHAPRVKALGHVLHSDLDMWPFAIRGEHDEMLPGVVATVLHEMGYEAEDKNVQAVIDEVAECRRMLKDMNHGLLGAGKVGEILRLVNQRRSEARESGATAVLGMLPCLEVLRCAFSADLEVLNAGKEKERDGGGVCEAGGAELASQALLLRAQHEHREFAFCAEAIISELLVVRQRSKSARAGDDDAAVLVSNEVLMRRHSRLAWTRCEVAARMYVDFDAILRDRAASRMWEGAFGVACHVELPRFVAAFEEHCGLGPAEACVSETVAGLMDECRDGVATLWAFHRLLALFGPLSTLAHTLAAEVRGGYLHPRLAECEARAALRGEPHAFVVIPAQETASLRVVWNTARGEAAVTTVSRASGAWCAAAGRRSSCSSAAGAAYELLADLVAASGAWRVPRGHAFDNVPSEPAAVPDGTSPLHRACSANNAGMVDVLLQRGGALTCSQRTWAQEGPYAGGLTPLMLSVANEVGSPEAVARLLIDAGADVDAVDDAGESVLYKAVLHRRPNVVLMLKACGASRYTADGTEPLLVALGPSHHNAWYKHDVALRHYKPCPATVRALLDFYVDPVDDVECVEEALDVCEQKLRLDCDPPPGSIHLYKAEKAEALREHSQRFQDPLRHTRRILREHATVLRTKQALAA